MGELHGFIDHDPRRRRALGELRQGESEDIALDYADALRPPVLDGIRHSGVEFGEAGDRLSREVGTAVVALRWVAVCRREPARDRFD